MTIAPNRFDQITEALGFDMLAPQEQEDLLLELNALIFRGSLVRLVERMDDRTRDEFNALIDSDPTEERMEQFLMQNVPDAEQAVEDTVQELTSDILAVTHA